MLSAQFHINSDFNLAKSPHPVLLSVQALSRHFDKKVIFPLAVSIVGSFRLSSVHRPPFKSRFVTVLGLLVHRQLKLNARNNSTSPLLCVELEYENSRLICTRARVHSLFFAILAQGAAPF